MYKLLLPLILVILSFYTVNAQDYSITTTPSSIIVTDLSGNADELVITGDGTNINIVSAPFRTYSLNGGGTLGFPVSLPLAGITDIIFNGQAGNDVFNFGIFSSLMPNLTVNGGTGNDLVLFNQDITFQANASLDLDLQNDDVTPGTDRIDLRPGVNLIFSGSGSATLRASRDIQLNLGSSIEVVNGNIILEANQQAVPTAADFVGIDVEGATIISTGNGSITVNGKGGNTSNFRYGVHVRSGGAITGGNSGTVAVSGTGGITSFSVGVVVSGAGSIVNSTGASINVIGQGGGSGAAQNCHGITLDNGGLISAGGTGTVTVTGTGGAVTGIFNTGIFISGASSQINSAGGSVSLVGTGGGTGASTSNLGIYILDADVSAGATANLSITGNGGSTGGGAVGIYITGSNASISTSGGSIILAGTGGGTGATADNFGTFINNGAIIQAGSSGNINITGTAGTTSGNGNYGVLIESINTLVSTTGGNVSITGQGGGSLGSNSNYGVVIRLAAQVSGGLIGNVMINGTGGLLSTGGNNTGVLVNGVNTQITSFGGDVTINGIGGSTGASGQNHGVAVTDGARIASGGTGTVNVNGSGGPTSGVFNVGVNVNGGNATITSAEGNVNINGTGGGAGASAFNLGVLVQSGFITLGGSGTLSVVGAGGSGTGANHAGVAAFTSGTIASLINGNIIINGTGGGSITSGSNFGVWVSVSSTINAAGTGTVAVTGIGGGGSGNLNHGVNVDGSGCNISSAGGSVTVTGFAGPSLTGTNNHGVVVQNQGLISAGGSGMLNVNGTGGNATGFFNYGVLVTGLNSRITSGGGDITVTGNGGGTGISANNHGVYVINGAEITSPGAVVVIGQGGNNSGDSNYGVFIEANNAGINSTNSSVFVTGFGGGSTASSFNYGVYVYATGYISAGGSGTVSVTGNGGNTTGNFNLGVYVAELNSRIISNNGNVSVTGTAGGTGVSANNRGIWVQSSAVISAGGNGNLALIGAGSANATGNGNHGVYVHTTNATIGSVNGNISITGVAGGSGTSANNTGVLVESSGRVSATGSGNIIINGTGGSGSGNTNRGVNIFNANSFVQTANGNISVTGTGGGTSTSGDNVGVNVSGSANIIAGGTGTVSVEGYGGAGEGNSNAGVLVSDALSAISSNNGDVDINGTGGGSGASTTNAGVFVLGLATVSAGGNGLLTILGTGGGSAGAGNAGVLVVSAPNAITSGGGNVSITGIEGTGASPFGIYTANSVITTALNGGDILFSGNSIELDAGTAVNTNLLSSVSILPYTNGVQIDLGSILNPVGGPLGLSDAELDRIVTGTLIIGDVNSGAITVSTDITRGALTNVELHSADDINISGGGINTAGGTLLLDAGDAPATVNPTFIGMDVTISTVTLAGDLSIVINGTIEDTEYTQLAVTGSVNLNGVNLVISGLHNPAFNQTFVIVDNDGVDPIIGTFAGLPEGGVISNFMGSLWSAMISYAGGDGNDVVLTIFAPCPPDNHFYVDADATGVSNGASWANAFTDLQHALILSEGCPLVTQIWVAEGTYYPTQDSVRSATFTLKNNLAIYGGFDGTETLLSERDWETNVTILSGDIGRNDDAIIATGDLLTNGSRSENSYHVVTGTGTDNSAILDGFTITGGNANFGADDTGGGMYSSGGSPTVANCIFSANSSGNHGGAMYNSSNSNPVIFECTFTGNQTGNAGGGMHNTTGSSPTVSNCVFSGNLAANAGGMENNLGSNPSLENCQFVNNAVSGNGGGMVNYLDANPSLLNCTFTGNSSGNAGGAMLNLINSSPSLINCSFIGNSAGTDGGAIHNNATGAILTLTNCLFSGNITLGLGGGLYNVSSAVELTNCTFSGNSSLGGGGGIFNNLSTCTITNCIVWNNRAAGFVNTVSASIQNISSFTPISHSIIANSGGSGGAWDGALGTDNGNNKDTDPLFVENVNLDAPFPNTTGDLHLTACSPAINMGLNSANSHPADLDGNDRIFGSIIDMGAYELQEDPTPTIAVCQNITVYLDALGSVTVMASDVDNGSSGCEPLTIEINGEQFLDFDCTDTGANTITLAVTSSLGQMASCTAVVTVLDTIAPVITNAAQNLTVECNANTNGTSLQSWLDNRGGATAIDNCDSITWTNVLVVEVPGCGNTTCYTYNFIATDASDNSSSTTAIFCVADTTAPVAICRTDTVTIQSNGTYVFTPEDVLNFDLSSDNCGTVSVTGISPASVNCTNLNQYVLVTVTVSDECGNTSQCTASMFVEVGDGLPTGWQTNHIGQGTGSSEFDPCIENGEFTISSTGFSFGTSDAQQFTHRSLCGDGSIIAKVTSLSGGGWAGVQIRETLAPGSKKADLKTQLTNHVRREIRAATNGMVQSQTITALGRTWLRLDRVGNTFTGYHSTNGVNWQFAFSGNVQMNSCVEIGLIVESINASAVTTATFSSVVVTGNEQNRPVALQNEEVETISDILLFPNPTNGQINIDLGLNAGKYSKLHIVNALGQVVDSKELGKDRYYYFDLNLAPGMYTVIFDDKGNLKGNHRLIVH